MKGSVGVGRGVAEVRLAVRLAHPPADVPPDRPAEGRPPANVPNSTAVEHVIGAQRARKRPLAYENPPSRPFARRTHASQATLLASPRSSLRPIGRCTHFSR